MAHFFTIPKILLMVAISSESAKEIRDPLYNIQHITAISELVSSYVSNQTRIPRDLEKKAFTNAFTVAFLSLKSTRTKCSLFHILSPFLSLPRNSTAAMNTGPFS